MDAALKAKLPSTLEILNPSSAQDKDSVTVTQATANKDHLKSIADLKPFAKNMVIGGPSEFKTRTDGLVGLKKNYGLTFKSFVPLDESGPLTLAALKDGKVQAADVFTTTPQIVTDKLVALADPKFNFAAQNVDPAGLQEGGDPDDHQHAERDLAAADHRGPAPDGQGGHPGSRQLLDGRPGLAEGGRPGLISCACGPGLAQRAGRGSPSRVSPARRLSFAGHQG